MWRGFRESIGYVRWGSMGCHPEVVLPVSDVQGSAQSPEARAAEPQKPEPSRALEWAW
jgi:hypothetical protein